ncbi:IS21 family transposase [Paucibacter sp. KCTC 42545]|uniref:IS21 family transposase n=1 Tax=Paucibacter sp. KCTC 42545 TaxID=1768242 RepID=UPI000733C00A|nr:IS21 family transposase [Paucibacter sp. KCTC 42545]ALT77387.1 transposase [Paucibacter sp. KCTC 42545]ALT77857.1 transposase [Paucibacter sp. KCTC 42545]ALT77940.1 transposase [Paucibacter sp. KCTC 42545]ALT79287.1 transposase [Paucibacter sp. KCTC 42545]
MPTPRVTMSKIRHTLQLLHSGKLSQRQIGTSLGISKSTVSEIASYARVAGLDWNAAQALSDAELQGRLYRPAVARQSRHLEPDYATLHIELKRPGVTLQLLWEEYQAQHQGQAYKYSAFCEKYQQWAQRLRRSMRQTHEAGDKLFVDYAGQTVPMVDAATGEITQAQVFVAVLGASNYTYACATPAQKAADWVACIIATLEFIGGVPRLLVPDQPRALMIRPDRYEPTSHRLLDELSHHYGLAVLPARPAKPRDKPKVEVAVQVVERWILARLRHQQFFSLAALNKAIAALLQELNQRPFKKLPGCRASAFASLDRPLLGPLPATRMAIARFKPARVNIDYHVELDGHYYSAPHRLVGRRVELRITATTLEVLEGQARVAVHALSPHRGAHSTAPEHMPPSHRAHLQWTPDKLITWAEGIGAATAAVVRWQMERRAHPEQGYRSCLGLMRLGREYGHERLEAACARAQSIRAPNYKSVASILQCGLDQRPIDAPLPTQTSLPLHANLRGPDYYH